MKRKNLILFCKLNFVMKIRVFIFASLSEYKKLRFLLRLNGIQNKTANIISFGYLEHNNKDNFYVNSLWRPEIFDYGFFNLIFVIFWRLIILLLNKCIIAVEWLNSFQIWEGNYR